MSGSPADPSFPIAWADRHQWSVYPRDLHHRSSSLGPITTPNQKSPDSVGARDIRTLRVCAKNRISRANSTLSLLSSPFEKIFLLASSGKSPLEARPVLPHMRDVSRIVRSVGAGCGGRLCALDEGRAKRTAKSCGPDIPTLISGATRKRCHLRRQESPVSGASAKETVKTIARGVPGEPA